MKRTCSTARRHAPEDHEVTLGAFIQQSLDGILIIDAQGTVLEWSEAEERITGIPRFEALGRPLWELQYRLAPPAKRNAEFLRVAREKIFTGFKEGFHLQRLVEDEIQRPDGTQRILQCIIFPLPKGRGKKMLAGGICRDITVRKEAEKALQEAQAQLKAHAGVLEITVAARTAKLQETIAELERFSYAIVHDLRAPLRAIQSFAGFIEEESGGTLDGLSLEYFRRIRAACDRMDHLITDLLKYSQAARQELPLNPIDLGQLLRDMVRTYPDLMADKARIRIAPNLPRVLGNAAGLTQCFSNLLGNAVKFAKPGTTPQIYVWAEETEPAGAGGQKLQEGQPSALPEQLIRIWVRDDGIGIPKDAQPRIFDIFQRVTDEPEGTGIGLSIVRKVVERMGGGVGVESEEGRGSRFWVELRKPSA